MRIQRVAVKNFRKLRDPVEINGLQPGLNVIVGDNEEGKSTLLKAVQAAFFDKHSMTGQAVEAMLPFGARVQPNVEVEFEVGGAGYSLRKGFFQNKFAQLKGANGSWENAAAEDKLRKILEFTPRSHGSANDEHRGLSGPLWVEQGRAYEPLELNKDVKKALNEAIEQELDRANAGDDGLDLLSAVRSKFEEHYTEIREDERGRLRQQRILLRSLKEKKESLAKQKKEYDDKLRRLEKIKRKIPKIQRGFNKALRKVDAVRAIVGRIEEIEGNIAIADANLATSNAQLEAAKSLFRNRNEKKKSLSAAQKNAKEKDEIFSGLNEQYKDAKNRLDEAEENLEQAQLECKRAELKAGSDKLAQAEAIEKRIIENQEAIIQIPIANEDVDDLGGLQDELNIQKARLEAMATTLDFSPSGNQSVSFNGEKLEVDKPYRITEKALFKLEGFGELAVTPGGDEEDIRNCRSSVKELKQKLTEGLNDLRYSSVKEANKAWNRKKSLLDTIKIGEAKLQGLAPEGLESLRLSIRRLREDLPQAAAESAAPVLSVDEAEVKRREAQGMWEGANQAFSAINETWNTERGAVTQLKESIARLKTELDQDRETNSDEVLETNANKAEKAHQKRQNRRNKLNAKLRELNPDSTREKLVSKKKSRDELQKLLDAKTEKKNTLEGELRGLGALGLGEEIGKKYRECKSARTELERLELDAKAWKLLRDTLLTAQEEERVPITPLMERLAPYVELVFPGAKLHLNESSLEIKDLEREHTAQSEPFSSLSIGTREQIAVLVRLAMADLLREQGKPVMLILDDPLVNSDDGRFEGMARALCKAARNLQILILTCHEHRYKSLGAKTIRLMDAENQASIADLLAMPNAAGIDFEPARLGK